MMFYLPRAIGQSLLLSPVRATKQFQVEFVLSEPADSWTGRKGRVDQSLLRDFLSRLQGSKCYVCVCGPTAFTELTVRLVKQLGFSEEELHAFQG
ncbi:hypothetical protein LDENG_00119570 [Lucifuga dentata]|nr:hypothetical protein LDENG_00119570 [Lucifuga dentata]